MGESIPVISKMMHRNEDSVLVVIFFTERCNLNCRYCYAEQSQKTMSWDVARQSVNFIASLPYNNKTICYMGGEPLVEWALVKKITRYAQGKGIDSFNLCTNMILLDRKKLDFFEQNNFNIMLSLDGILEAQDVERMDHANCGSFLRINKKIDLISSYRVKIRFTIQMSISPSNVKYLSKSFRYFFDKNIANTKLYLVPIVDTNYIWTKEHFEIFDKETSQLFKFYHHNKDRLKECKLIFGKCCSSLGQDELKRTKNLNEELCLCNKKYFGIDVKGDVFYCFFAGFSKYKKLRMDYKLGDIWHGIASNRKLNEFSGKKMKRYMSCLAWNYIVNRDVRRPVDIYKKLYSIWIKNE